MSRLLELAGLQRPKEDQPPLVLSWPLRILGVAVTIVVVVLLLLLVKAL